MPALPSPPPRSPPTVGPMARGASPHISGGGALARLLLGALASRAVRRDNSAARPCALAGRFRARRWAGHPRPGRERASTVPTDDLS